MPNPLNYPGYTPADTAPYYNSAAVTPSDSKDLPIVSRAILVGTAGALAVTLLGDADGVSTVLYAAAGVILPIRVKRVWATSTAAGAIVALN